VVNIPRSTSEEVITVSSQAGSVVSVASSERTIEYTPDETPVISDDEETYETEGKEIEEKNTTLVVDELDWHGISAYSKYASNTASFFYVLVDNLSADMSECLVVEKVNPKRKEASKEDVALYKKLFQKAKEEEYQSWIKNNVFKFLKLKGKPDNFVTGRWVLTVKRDNQGMLLKCKARWVLRSFQDQQK